MGIRKSNIFDYIDWRGDLTFGQGGFCEVDALVLSALAYLDFSFVEEEGGVSFREVAGIISGPQGDSGYEGPVMIKQNVLKLAVQAAESVRFGEMGVSYCRSIFDEGQEIQFAAITFLLPDGTAFLSFRGTDSTLVGWKENFNMGFINGVPSQLEAADYAAGTARKTERPLRLGGHSKGGNLAVWAAAHLPEEYQSRILGAYSNDGPGFNEEFLQSDGYVRIRDRVFSYVPESSIVGVLLEHDEYTTIRSFNPTVFQHDPFSWLVRGNHFVYGSSRSFSGRQLDKRVNLWIQGISAEEREKWIEGIYAVLTMANGKMDSSSGRTKKSLSDLYEKLLRERGKD